MTSNHTTARLTPLSGALTAAMIASAWVVATKVRPGESRRRILGMLALLLVTTACNSPGVTNQLPYWGGKAPDRNVTVPNLPVPAPMPPGSPDQAAAALAVQITSGGPGSFPAILAGLQASGFAVRDGIGGVLLKPAMPSQGFAIDSAQAVAMGMSVGNPAETTLADFAATLGVGITDLKGAQVPALILDGIRTHAGDTSPTMRFWAHLLIELGKVPRFGYDGYDLTSATLDPATTHLDLVQLELILFRLDTDLIAVRDRIKGGGTAAVSPQWPGPITNVYAAGSGNCNLSESESQIMDIAAASSMTGFDKLMEYLAEAESLSEGAKASVAKIAHYTGLANVVLAYSKVVMYYAALNVTVTMDGAGPLIRTKKTAPGEQRHLIGHARMDAKNSQMINCFRIMLNILGMDLSGPSDGDLAGSVAEWRLVKGGVSGTSTKNRIVQFFGGDPIHGKTNEQGIATIGIEGYQQKSVIPDKTAAVTKQAEVWLSVQPKPVSFTQDATDAVAGAAGGLVGGFLTLPAEMLLRSNLLMPAELPFDVVDWQTGYLLTITVVSGPSAGGEPNTVPLTVEGALAENTPGSPLSGPGELHGEGYKGSCLYYPDGGWTDAGPVSVPVTLMATDKGDGNMDLTINTGAAEIPLPGGTFPAGGGTVMHDITYQDCGPRSATETITAEPIGG